MGIRHAAQFKYFPSLVYGYPPAPGVVLASCACALSSNAAGTQTCPTVFSGISHSFIIIFFQSLISKMGFTNIVALFGALSLVQAAPQNIDFNLADLTPDPSDSSAQTITYNPAAAASSVVADINAGSLPQPTKAKMIKRTSGNCSPKAIGAGPVPSPDTVQAFLADPDFASAASAAPTPTGYTNRFTNLNASNNAYGYMGFTTLNTYDSVSCASQCNTIIGCMAVNIFFERDPSLDVGPACPNPASTTNIKCVFWRGPVTVGNANNYGYTDNNFTIAIAGSNGYVNNTIAPVPGYTGPDRLGNAAINAPNDCNSSVDAYLGQKNLHRRTI